MLGTDLISIAVYPWPPEVGIRGHGTSACPRRMGNPVHGRRYERLVRSMTALPDDRACVVIAWNGSRVPVGVSVGRKSITSVQRGWVMASGTYIGIYDRIADGGHEDCGDHEMLIVITNPDCVRRLRDEGVAYGIGPREADACPMASADL